MKVLVQYARRNPRDLEEIDAAQWAGLAKRPVPQAGELGGQDNAPGWFANVMVQGITSNGYDHVAVESLPDGGVRFSMWNDDPVDWPGQRVAHVWTILPLAPDPTFGSGDRERLLDSVRNDSGVTAEKRAEILDWYNDPAHWPMNTHQSQVIYADNVARYAGQDVRPWGEFVAPPEEVTRHGVWMTDAKFAEHLAASHVFQDNDPGAWSWSHWADHLPASETDIDSRGRRVLKSQRAQGRYAKATRTITYYQRSTSLPQGWVAASHEYELQTTAGASETTSVTTNAGTVQSWVFASPSGSPNTTNWDGVYHAQLDCTAASGGLQYMVGAGNPVDVNAQWFDLTSDLGSSSGNVFQAQAAVFTGTGLKLATSGSETYTAVATSRFGIAVNATGDSHGDAITLRFSSDAYADGPWRTTPVENPMMRRYGGVPHLGYAHTNVGRTW